MTFDSQGNLLVAIAQFTNKVSRVSGAGVVSTAVTLPRATDATDLAFDSTGRLYISSQGGLGVGSFAKSTDLVMGLAFDSHGDLFVVDQGADRLWKVTKEGTVGEFVRGLRQPIGIVAVPDPGPFHLAAVVQSDAEVVRDGRRLRLSGGLGRFYQLESTVDFTLWSVISTNRVIADTGVDVLDPTGGVGPFRFYRARSLP